MIIKSYQIENNIDTIDKHKFALFYGENNGLKDHLKFKIKKKYKGIEILNLYDEDFSKNKDILINEAKNESLFSKGKIIFVNQANDKITKNIEYLMSDKSHKNIILFSDILDKKSTLRNLFEKDKTAIAVACYQDNEVTLKKLAIKNLKEFTNINDNHIRMIVGFCNLDRTKLISNIIKIKTYFDKNKIDENELEILLRSDTNEIFNDIRDAVLTKDKLKLNNLLNDFVFIKEDAYIYFNSINTRLLKLLDIFNLVNKNVNLDNAVDTIKPPIFWKDKPIYKKMMNKWDKSSILEAVKYLGKIDKMMKTNSNVNGLTLIKNSLNNICSTTWTYF